jgi:hypothetical protein
LIGAIEIVTVAVELSEPSEARNVKLRVPLAFCAGLYVRFALVPPDKYRRWEV